MCGTRGGPPPARMIDGIDPGMIPATRARCSGFVMRIFTQFGLFAGLSLLIGLLIWQGVVDVFGLLLSSGWLLLLLPLAWLPNLIPATEAWRQLFGPGQGPRFTHALLAMWMGRAVNNLLPVATIGGEIVKARLVYLWGCRGTGAAASVIVDKTIQVIAVILWGLIGVSILLLISANDELAFAAMAGFAVLAVCVAGFFALQRAGMFGFLARWGERLLPLESIEGITLSAREIDAAVLGIYSHKHRIGRAVWLKTLGLVLQTAEVWAACLILGHPIGLLEAAMLKSLTATLSDVAFIIPNAYGIQEGAYVLVGALVGLPPDLSLAVSLAIRIRDLLLDPAGLLTLHRVESRRRSAAVPRQESN